MAKNATSTTMVITEIQNSGSGSLTSVKEVFRWSSAEHSSAQAPIDLQLMVKTVRKEIPGSNNVVEHGLSATWQPFQMMGEWDDKWGNRRNFSANGNGAYAFNTFRDFSAFVQRMPFVRIEIDSLSFVGIITELKIRWVRQARIGWAITFSPHQNETITAVRPPKQTRQSITQWTVDVKAKSNNLNDSFDRLKKLALKTQRVDDFTRVMLELNDAVDRVNRISIDGFGTDVEKRLLLMAQTFRRLRGSAVAVALALRNVTSPIDVAYDDMMLTVNHMDWWTSSLSDAWAIVGISTRAERDVRSRIQPNTRAIYYPKRGESLERISFQFYQTPDNWRAIQQRNNLSSLILDGTEELIIPERTTI